MWTLSFCLTSFLL